MPTGMRCTAAKYTNWVAATPMQPMREHAPAGPPQRRPPAAERHDRHGQQHETADERANGDGRRGTPAGLQERLHERAGHAEGAARRARAMTRPGEVVVSFMGMAPGRHGLSDCYSPDARVRIRSQIAFCP